MCLEVKTGCLGQLCLYTHFLKNTVHGCVTPELLLLHVVVLTVVVVVSCLIAMGLL